MNLSPSESAPQARNGLTFGCLGAILIHPLLFVMVFLKGFVLGSAQERVMSATGGSGPTKYLFDGGLNAMGNLAIYYIFVGFIVIPITSLIGSALALVVGKQWSRSSSMIDVLRSSTPPFAEYSRKLGIWAAAVYITNYCVSYLLFQFGITIGWDLWGLIVGCNFGIWIIGSISAYFIHRDWRVSTGLIGIYLCLLLMRYWLPGFGLLIASVGTLFCLVSYPEKKQSDNSGLPEDPDQLGKNDLSGQSVFALGGFTYYTLICLYCLSWAVSSGSGGEDWAPFMVLILGAWGIPILSGITLLLYRRTGLRSWMKRTKITNRIVWTAVAGEVCVCGFSWLGVVLNS